MFSSIKNISLSIRVSLLAILTALSRLPFIFDGFGSDPDSWRVALAARTIYMGGFAISRSPGYPVQELVSSLVIPFGAVGTNLLSLFFSVIAVLFFYGLLLKLKVEHALLAALGFALTPVIYINSVSTIDYVWAIAFILGSLFFLVERRYLIAGILLGLAVGCRLTSLAMLLPLTIFLYREENKNWLKRYVELSLVTLITAIICFIPQIYVLGLESFTFYDSSHPSVVIIIQRAGAPVWGRIGLTALLVCLGGFWFSKKHFKRSAKCNSLENSLFVLSITAVIIYFMLYLRLPYESGYLVPIVPFVILIMALMIKGSLFRALCIALLFSSFISPCRRAGICNGAIIANMIKKEKANLQIEETVKILENLPGKTVTVAGWFQPPLEMTLAENGLVMPKVIYLLNESELKEYIRHGYSIYYLNGFDQVNNSAAGAKLSDFGAQLLEGSELAN